MSALSSFTADYDQKSVDFDGMYGYQCVDSVAFYVRDYLKKPVMYADAAYWYLNFPGSALEANFDRYANVGAEVPQPGDVVIWNTNLPNSGGAGHIAVCVAPRPGTGTFISFDQNWGGKYCHQVVHTYDYVLGWLRPKQVTTGEDMINDYDNEWGRWRALFVAIRGREPSRDEFRSAGVGRTWLSAMEILQDSTEAEAAQHAQEIGQQSIRDNWPGQIFALQDQLNAAQDATNKINVELASVLADKNATKAQLTVALENVAKANTALQTANDKLKDVQNASAVALDTNKKVTSIFDYFSGQFKIFSKYKKKGK